MHDAAPKARKLQDKCVVPGSGRGCGMAARYGASYERRLSGVGQRLTGRRQPEHWGVFYSCMRLYTDFVISFAGHCTEATTLEAIRGRVDGRRHESPQFKASGEYPAAVRKGSPKGGSSETRAGSAGGARQSTGG